MRKEIACFVSPHGFGHATRAIAVVEALQLIDPEIHAHFFTTVPSSLFKQTLTNFTYHFVPVDVGLVQSSAFDSDIPATIKQLDHLLPFAGGLVDELAELCSRSSLILCDIAPLGIAVGKACRIPSIVVENFTWDWIYQPYFKRYPELQGHAEILRHWFDRADFRIQTEPLCNPAPSDLCCQPIFRRKRGRRTELVEHLGCSGKKLIVVTMGGVYQEIPPQLELSVFPGSYFLFTGQRQTKRLNQNLAFLGRDSAIYHPDLIAAADVVVCKAGYSTVAECCQAGVRVLAIGRDGFAETKILQDYLGNRLGGVSIAQEKYQSGEWPALAIDLLSCPRSAAAKVNGADQVALFLHNLL